MVKKTKHATTNFKRLKPFLEKVKQNDGYFKFKSQGYMDLNFEDLCYLDCYGFPVYCMAHNSVQFGDLMADPEMTFSVDYENGRIIPQTFRNDYMGLYQYVFREINGTKCYSPSLLTDLDHFMYQWLNNLENQGFKA